MQAARQVVMLLGPHRAAMSGVSTHIGLLMHSDLASAFSLVHFQVGSEGRRETRRARLSRFVLSPLQLAAAILKSNAAIVHLNTSLNRRAFWRDLGYLVVARLCGARVVLQVHGGAPPRMFARNNVLLYGLLRSVLMLADRVVVLARTEFMAYSEICRTGRLLCIPNGVDCSSIESRPAVLAPSGRLKLIYIGRLVREKGLHEALEAIRLVVLRGAKVKLVLVGSGSEEMHLRRRARELGIESEVLFAGPASGADKFELLRAADVFLLPSYSEGLPYALIEAMAAGLPAIATPVGAIPDVMEDGIHGRLVPCRDPVAIGNAIVELSDGARLARMSLACRGRIETAFSMQRVAGEFAGLYAQLCAPKPARLLQRP